MADAIKLTKKEFFNFDTLAEEMTLSLQVQGRTLGEQIAGTIQQMYIRGMSQDQILDNLMEDLVSNGRIFGGVTRGLSEAVGAGYDDIAQGEIFDANPETQTWEWIVTSSNPCSDCLPRHKETATYQEWQSIGLPRSGFSVCRDRCKCVLLPTGKATADLDDPVIVPSVTDLRAEFQTKLQSDTVLQQRIADYKEAQHQKRRKAKK